RCPWVSPGLPGYGVTTATISADSAAPEPRASSSPAGAVGLAGVAAGGCGAAGPSGALCGPALNRLRAQREDGASQDLLLARAARRPPQVQPGEGFAGDDDPDRARGQCEEKPPSTKSMWPVTKAAASLARKTAAPSTSSGTPLRRVMWRAASCSTRPGMAWAGSVSGVRTKPGMIVLTDTPRLDQASAWERVRPARAALAAP